MGVAAGRTVETDWMEPRWDAKSPPTDDELVAKYHEFADQALVAEVAEKFRSDLFADRLPAPSKILETLAKG